MKKGEMKPETNLLLGFAEIHDVGLPNQGAAPRAGEQDDVGLRDGAKNGLRFQRGTAPQFSKNETAGGSASLIPVGDHFLADEPGAVGQFVF